MQLETLKETNQTFIIPYTKTKVCILIDLFIKSVQYYRITQNKTTTKEVICKLQTIYSLKLIYF